MKNVLNRMKLKKEEELSIDTFVGKTVDFILRDFTMQEDSEYQAVDDAAVSSLTFILTSCVPNFEASNTNSRDPVVGSEVCETVMLIDTLLLLEFVTAIAGKRSMRGDDTDIFVKQAELAGSLI